MGRKENPLLVYYNQNERFAQLLNGWLFRGRPRLEAGDIKEADRRAEGKGGKSGKRREYRSRYRDLYKRLDSAAVRLYVGAEPMEYVDYAMPLRVMDSDTLSYLHQKKEISRRYAEHKGLEGDEYLSRFTKKDRLLPVVTLVLYCGERPWDGARSLHGMLELDGVPEELKEYVEDYSLHILDVCHTPDDQNMNRIIFHIRLQFLRQSAQLQHFVETSGPVPGLFPTIQHQRNHRQQPILL